MRKAGPVSVPDDSPSLQTAFEDGYINFSHFVQAGDTDVIKLGLLYHTLLRGMAYDCTHLPNSIDLIAAIHFGNPSTTEIAKEHTSVLQVQIRNRAEAETPQCVYADPTVAAPSSDKPVISLFLALGSNSSLVYTDTRRNVPTR